MVSHVKVAGIVALALMWMTTTVTAQSPPPNKPATPKTSEKASTPNTPAPASEMKPAEQPEVAKEAKPAKPDKVAVTVNGHHIMDSDIDEVLKGGREATEEQLVARRKQFGDQVTNYLIDLQLLDGEAKKYEIKVTDEEMLAKMEGDLEVYLKRMGKTREQFAKEFQARSGTTLEEEVAKRAADPIFRKTTVHMRVIDIVYADKLKIDDKEVTEFYEKNLERRFTKQEMVKASHILIGVTEASTEEERLEASNKIEEILKEAKKPDADFAALAKEHSTGPSAPKGGDLGSFPRTGRMVEPFAAAAFALQPGEISDVVETQFGFHIIKVTERTPGGVTPLDEVKEELREELKVEKRNKLRDEYIAKLKESAEIVYPAGKPASAPPPQPGPSVVVKPKPAAAPAPKPEPAPKSKPAPKKNKP